MASVDNRVVSIRFDNASFMNKVSETQRTLDKLKQNLDFANAQRSMGDLGRAAQQVDLEPLAASSDGVSARFVAMSAVIFSVLNNVVTRAISAGSQITKALTIAPVMDGFREYETNMNSIQTILANTQSKGSTLGDVEAALQNLNEYSDKTIYNFAEMARNIGTFTAAGVDLDTSTSAIKGIANVAAISGSNSQQASTAMYQLSQAIAQGNVKLMDWNSVVNAGMGGEVFKSALFETGKAMGTIADVPLDQTFTEWEDSGNSFRESLQDEWLTGDVLTRTLEAFTGDFDAAQLESMGYTREQAIEMERLGKLGVAAATEVKTITQLVGTVKEAIGTGWADSMKLIIGDFEEAKTLFTGMNNYISGVVGRSADARNEMLQTWKDFGGRDTMIQALKTAFQGLLTIFAPIKEAFRDIFPKTTAEDLLVLTARFSEFSKRIAISGETADKIKSIFGGLFSIFSIGWEVIKGVASVIGDVFKALMPAGEAAGTAAAGFGDFLINLRETLVEGGAIKRFFENLGNSIQPALSAIADFGRAIADIFTDDAEVETGRVTERFGVLRRVAELVGEAFSNLGDKLDGVADFFRGLQEAIQPAIDYIKELFIDLGEGISSAFDGGDFSTFTDVFNVAAIAAIILMVRRLIKSITGGIDTANGIMESLSGVFEGLTDTLAAMQTKLKADALMKLAIAVGVLTASVVVMSLIDSDALSRALGAMAVGFGELAVMMLAMTKMDITGLKLSGLALGMTLMAASMILMGIAVTIFARLDLEEIARGLGGVAASMAIMVIGMNAMPTEKMGVTALQLLAVGLALNIMAIAVKQFAEMEMGEMGRGLLGVAASMLILAAGMEAMPEKKMGATALGLILVGGALLVMGLAVKQFANMDMDTMMRGMLGVASSLLIVAAGMNAMPDGGKMLAAASGLFIVSAALIIMSQAVSIFGNMEMDTMIQGLGGVAAMLLILSIATNSMSSAIGGALSMVIVAGALRVLADVLVILGDMSLGQIGGALLALAGVLVVLGIAALGATYIAPGLLILAASLIAIGVGFALIGAGAYLAARAFQIFAEAGSQSFDVMREWVLGILDMIPEIAAGITQMILRIVQGILDGLPPLIESLGVVIESILTALTDLLPELGEFLSTLISELIEIARENYPDLIELGFEIIDAILTGLDENIEEITNRAASILTQFINAIAENLPMIVEAGVNLITTFLNSIAERASEITATVANLIISFIAGITASLPQIQQAATTLIITFLVGLGSMVGQIVQAGTAIIINLIQGITNSLWSIIAAATNMVTTLIAGLSASANRIVTAGADAIVSFISGLSNAIGRIIAKGTEMVTNIITGISGAVHKVVTAGADAIIKFATGLGQNASRVVAAGAKALAEFARGVATNAIKLANTAAGIIIDFVNALAAAIDRNAGAMRSAGSNLARAIIDGMTGGLASGVGRVVSEAKNVATSALDAAMGALGINSPSREFIKIGEGVNEGFAIGLRRDSDSISASREMANHAVDSFRGAVKSMADKMVDLDDISPTITPVLDLSRVENEAGRLAGMMQLADIAPEVSYNQARYLQHTTDDEPDNDESSSNDTGPREIVFNQYNNSPKALSTADVYRNTRSQIALAKEELGIR